MERFRSAGTRFRDSQIDARNLSRSSEVTRRLPLFHRRCNRQLHTHAAVADLMNSTMESSEAPG